MNPATPPASPKLADLPAPPPGRTGWPWTADSAGPADQTAGDPAEWPRISVVTPSFQQGRFLEETIRSVLLQGYPNLQYIVMDGGSNDESLDILRRYGPWLSFWASERDRGQTDAIRKGLDRADGLLWNWLNSDDLLQPGALFAIAESWRRNPQATVHAGRIEIFGGEQMELGPCFQSFEELVCVWNGWPIPQCAAYLSVEATRDAGGVETSLRYVMDYELYLRLALLPGFRTERNPETFARFRLHEASKTCKEQVAAKEELLIVFDRYARAHPQRMPRHWRRSRRRFEYFLELDRCGAKSSQVLLISWRYAAVMWAKRFYWSNLLRTLERMLRKGRQADGVLP